MTYSDISDIYSNFSEKGMPKKGSLSCSIFVEIEKIVYSSL